MERGLGMGLFSRLFSKERAGHCLTAHPRDSTPPQSYVRTKDIIWDDDNDGRRRISDATVSPYSGICLIQAYNNAGDTQAVLAGTGWLAGPDTVITAAHVVYDPDHLNGASGARAGIVQMWFGFNDDPEPPFGDSVSTKIFVPHAYQKTQDADHDIAVIRLNERVGDRLGWFDLRSAPDTHLRNSEVTVAGYPGEDKKRFKLYEGEKQILDASETRLYHNVDTTAGQSGAPIFVKSGRRPVAYGVHARGISEAFSTIGMSANFGVRFHPELLKWIKKPK
jgi:glutamyl endopeptidase